MTKKSHNLAVMSSVLAILAICALLTTSCSAGSEHLNKAVVYAENPANSSIKSGVATKDSKRTMQGLTTCVDSTASSSSFTLCAVGDINTGSRSAAYVRKSGYPNKNLVTLLKATDLTFGNLECALSNRGKPVPGKRFTFRGSPQDAHILKDIGFDCLSVANNHSKDYGNTAFLDTLKCLEDIKVAQAGGGKNLDEAFKPAIIKVNGSKIAILAFSGVLPSGFAATRNSCGVASLRDSKAVFNAIKKAKSAADFVVISLHWGKELSTKPSSQQIKLAHQLIDAGADVILGHHPHVVQGIELYKGKPIAYSLGNFMFSPGSPKGRQTILVSLKMQNGKFAGASIYPIYIEGIKPILLSGKRAQNWLSEVARRSRSFKTPLQIKNSVLYISSRPAS